MRSPGRVAGRPRGGAPREGLQHPPKYVPSLTAAVTPGLSELRRSATGASAPASDASSIKPTPARCRRILYSSGPASPAWPHACDAAAAGGRGSRAGLPRAVAALAAGDAVAAGLRFSGAATAALTPSNVLKVQIPGSPGPLNSPKFHPAVQRSPEVLAGSAGALEVCPTLCRLECAEHRRTRQSSKRKVIAAKPCTHFRGHQKARVALGDKMCSYSLATGRAGPLGTASAAAGTARWLVLPHARLAAGAAAQAARLSLALQHASHKHASCKVLALALIIWTACVQRRAAWPRPLLSWVLPHRLAVQAAQYRSGP